MYGNTKPSSFYELILLLNFSTNDLCLSLLLGREKINMTFALVFPMEPITPVLVHSLFSSVSSHTEREIEKARPALFRFTNAISLSNWSQLPNCEKEE